MYEDTNESGEAEGMERWMAAGRECGEWVAVVGGMGSW